MEQVVQFVGHSRDKVAMFAFLFINGLYALTKTDVTWGLGIIVSILAAWNYLDQIISRRKNKSSGNGINR